MRNQHGDWPWLIEEWKRYADADTYDLVIVSDWSTILVPVGAGVVTSQWLDEGFNDFFQTRQVTWKEGDVSCTRVDWRTKHLKRFRLLGVDTPERGDKIRHLEALNFVKNWVDLHSELHHLRATTHKVVPGQTLPDGAFGRYLINIVNDEGQSLTDALIEAGHTKIVA